MVLEHLIKSHSKQYERFVLLNDNLHTIELPIHAYGNICKYRILDINNEQYKSHQEFVWQANSIKPLSPVNVSYSVDKHRHYYINWHRRSKSNGGWLNNIDVPLEYSEEKYLVTVENKKGDAIFCKETGVTEMIVDLNSFDYYPAGGKLIIQQLSPLIGKGEVAIHHIAS